MTPDEIKEFDEMFPTMRQAMDKIIGSEITVETAIEAAINEQEINKQSAIKSFITSLLQRRTERLLAVIEEVRGKYKGDGLQGSRAFFYEQCCDDLAERIKSGI